MLTDARAHRLQDCFEFSIREVRLTVDGFVASAFLLGETRKSTTRPVAKTRAGALETARVHRIDEDADGDVGFQRLRRGSR